MNSRFIRNVAFALVLAGCGAGAFGATGETHLRLDIGTGIRFVPPSRVAVPSGEMVTIDAPTTMAGGANIWFKDQKPIAGATSATLVIPSATSSDSGVYVYAALSNGAPAGGSQALSLSVSPRANLLNLSTRGVAGTGEQILISGFVVGGTGNSTILIRAVGPSLTHFGVTGVLKEPKISIFNSEGKPYTDDFVYTQVVGSPSNKAEHIQQASAKIGAFALDPNGKDAVDIRPFPPGSYTIHVTSADGSTGVVLLELSQVPE